MRAIDADRLQKRFDEKSTNPNYRVNMHNIKSIISNAPTVEAIPKADYENRLKADMVAMLTELQSEFEKQCKIPNNNASAYDWNNGVYACYKVVQQKIDSLKGGEDATDNYRED